MLPGILITGQNTASSTTAAQTLLKLVGSKANGLSSEVAILPLAVRQLFAAKVVMHYLGHIFVPGSFLNPTAKVG